MTVRAKLDIRGVNKMMKLPRLEANLAERAQRIADRAGPGFESASDNRHPWVARAWVRSESIEAARAEASNLALTKAIDAGRD